MSAPMSKAEKIADILDELEADIDMASEEAREKLALVCPVGTRVRYPGEKGRRGVTKGPVRTDGTVRVEFDGGGDTTAFIDGIRFEDDDEKGGA